MTFSKRLFAFVLAVIASCGLASVATAATNGTEKSVSTLPRLAAPIGGQTALLVAVNYPLELSGRKVAGRITVRFPGGGKLVRKWTARPHGGHPRPGDRRATFRFVHSILLGSAASRRLIKQRRSVRVNSRVSYVQPTSDETLSTKTGSGISAKGIRFAPDQMCSTAPLVLLKARIGDTARGALPRCGSRASWTVVGAPDGGTASIQGELFRYTQNKRASGADEIELVGRSRGAIVSRQKVQLRVSPLAAASVSVRAMGDSVTAGFGYYGTTGRPMPFTSLFDCKPAAVYFNDACSSNSSNTNSGVGTTPTYLPDFGLSRNISWAAQWANQYGITDYKNYAVSGSAPSDWLPGGQFAATTLRIQRDNPDYIVMTMGGNPILSNVLFGLDNMGCALESDLFGNYRKCVEAAFAKVDLSGKLKALYTQLVNGTSSKIVLMQYHLAIPAADIAYTAGQIAMMDELMNQTIFDVAMQVSPERINVIAPPHFNVGIDMLPLYPARYSCSWFDWKVDGPSVQADPSQDLLELAHPLSFCSGPADGPPWVISGDTGIHPSAAGYTQMASQIPAPR